MLTTEAPASIQKNLIFSNNDQPITLESNLNTSSYIYIFISRNVTLSRLIVQQEE